MPFKPCPDCGESFKSGCTRVRCAPCATKQTEIITPVHRAFRKALKEGRVTRKACEVCGNPKTDGHHDDYSRPLDVRWLCRTHHRQHHRAETRART